MKKSDVAHSLYFVLGLLCIVFSLIGLLYNAGTLFIDYSDSGQRTLVPYFYEAFYIMSASYILCYLILFYCGIHFFRRKKLHFIKIFVGLMVYEICKYFIIGVLWQLDNPNISYSVASATGVAGGGMMVQLVIFFPLWAPIAAIWASKNLAKSDSIPLL